MNIEPQNPIPNQNLSSQIRSPEAWDYRSLLSEAIETLRASSGRAASFAALSQRFGFKSKSFLQHVIRGERHLSPESADRVARALQLDPRSRQIFVQLVRLAHLEAEARQTEAYVLRAQIQKLRSYRSSQANPLVEKTQKRRLYSTIDGPLIYAALGTPEKGATVDEICQRTGLAVKSVALTLEQWQDDAIVERIPGAEPARYRTALTFGYDDSEEGRASVREFCLRMGREAVQAAEKDFGNRDTFFAAWAFSIDSRRRAEFNARLRTLLLDYIVESEDPEGDRVIRVSVSAF